MLFLTKENPIGELRFITPTSSVKVTSIRDSRCSPPVKVIRKSWVPGLRRPLRNTDILAQSKRDGKKLFQPPTAHTADETGIQLWLFYWKVVRTSFSSERLLALTHLFCAIRQKPRKRPRNERNMDAIHNKVREMLCFTYVWGATAQPIAVILCKLWHLADVINREKFHVNLLRGFWFTFGQS
jgi:hypothetical protein